MKFKWEFKERSGRNVIQQIIENREYSKSFFEYNFANLPNPLLMKDIDKAADRIIEAVRNKESIVILGHDDPDGITSTYILFDFLEKLGSQNHYYYIPNRYTDHHGIQQNFIDKAQKENYDLVITVDIGISSYDEVEKLKKFGCDVIITDHHLIPEKIPQAFAVVDPKQSDCQYPFDMLAGVGVTFLLVQVISQKLSVPYDKSYILWTAIGTIADKVPLISVNRAICREAIENWFDYEDANLMQLRKKTIVTNTFFSKKYFILYVTRILSNGRMDGGENKGLQILLASIFDKQKLISSLLEEKHKFESQMFKIKEFLKYLQFDSSQGFLIFVDKQDKIPLSLLGMCATIISLQYKIPALFIHKKNGSLVCEARCTIGFNLVEAFEYCKNDLVQFGGHVQAAGFVIENNKVDSFKKHFKEYVSSHLQEIRNQHKLIIDAIVKPEDLNDTTIHELELIQPFGQKNPAPIFLMKNFTVEIGKEFRINYSDSFNPKPDGKYDIVFNSKNGFSLNMLDYRKLT